MSFLDYLQDNRGLYIDHRATPPTSAGTPLPEPDATTVSGRDGGAAGDAPSGRRRRPRRAALGIRYRHVRPAFAPSPYSEPLPYEPAEERAWR